MEKLVKNITIIILALGLFSCDDALDFLLDENQAPSLELIDQEGMNVNEISTRMKLSLKSLKDTYTFDYRISDVENGLEQVSLQLLAGDAVLLYEGAETSSLPIEEGRYSVEIMPTSFNTIIELRLTAKDAFGASSSVNVALEVFENLPPVANFIIQELKIQDEKEYQFNATESFDQDQDLGGGIAAYEYTINDGPIRVTTDPEFKWVFPSKGGYEVKLRVKDTDGAYSSITKRNITVE